MGYGLADAYAAVVMAQNMLFGSPCPEAPQLNTPALQLGTLQTIVPNPATSSIAVNYKLNGTDSAYLMIVSHTGNSTSNNYTLDTKSSQININIGSYMSGVYSVALIVNGSVVDSKSLIKQ